MASSEEILKSTEIIPDVLASAPKKFLRLSVTYPDAKFDGSKIPVLTPTQTQAAPTLKLEGLTKGAKYTVLMTDPDAPSRADPTYREFFHWAIVNVPSTGAVADGKVALDYIGAGPPHGSGKHRYVFLVFQQDKSTPVTADKFKDTLASKKTSVLMSTFKLQPVAAAIFEAEWDECVDLLHAKLGFLPPPKYQSPKQAIAAAAAVGGGGGAAAPAAATPAAASKAVESKDKDDERKAKVLMVLMDGSEFSTKALNRALTEKRDEDSLYVVHAVELLSVVDQATFGLDQMPYIDTDLVQTTNDKIKQSAHRLVEAVAKKLAEKKVTNAHAVVIAKEGGNPKEACVEFAEKTNVDTIYVGTRGLGAVKRLFLGSFSNYLINHCSCDVMVVR